ncbi:hypothetical protein EJK51_0348 [Moraxella catarrhalis]|nr:hypothetical protein MCR_0324 [Moraxella catarrhalis BBH18]AZQ91254.1 hypothetical protein EJK51_0348 [Moraxella catarrhalis]
MYDMPIIRQIQVLVKRKVKSHPGSLMSLVDHKFKQSHFKPVF